MFEFGSRLPSVDPAPVSLNNTLPKPRSGGRFARLMMSRSSTEVIGLGVEVRKSVGSSRRCWRIR
ncbi:hypothetical protein ACETU7_30090 [Rhodococcus sp. 3Y1]